jgi:hypothetical protein
MMASRQKSREVRMKKSPAAQPKTDQPKAGLTPFALHAARAAGTLQKD